MNFKFPIKSTRNKERKSEVVSSLASAAILINSGVKHYRPYVVAKKNNDFLSFSCIGDNVAIWRDCSGIGPIENRKVACLPQVSNGAS